MAILTARRYGGRSHGLGRFASHTESGRGHADAHHDCNNQKKTEESSTKRHDGNVRFYSVWRKSNCGVIITPTGKLTHRRNMPVDHGSRRPCPVLFGNQTGQG